jgi:RNA ligase (TIGR02306 family)
MYVRDGEFGVCSRNLDLKQDDTNTFWKMAIQYDVEQKLRAFGSNIAIQGEVVGESIQGNKYKLQGQKFFIFDIFNIDGGKYWESWRRIAWAQLHGFDHVPVLDKAAIIKADTTIQDLLISAEGASVLGGDNNAPEREGIVYKSIYFPDVSFKAISNKFLLHEKG